MSKDKSTIVKMAFYCDGLRLKGTLHLPSENRPSFVIGSHGLYSSSGSPKQIALAEQCNHLGIAYFRFDHRGCGDSEGEFEAVTSLEARCRDLAAAVTVIKDSVDTGDRFGLFGSSMGGTVCLCMASELGADTLVSFAAPIRSKILPKDGRRSDPSDPSGIFLDAHKRLFDISDRLSDISSILIFHGDADDVVPVSHAEEIYKLAKQPKKIIIQENGDHPMSNETHQRTFIREASLWFKRGLI